VCTKYYVWNLCAVYVGKCVGGRVDDTVPVITNIVFCFGKVDFSYLFTYSKLLNFNFNLSYQFERDLTEFHLQIVSYITHCSGYFSRIRILCMNCTRNL